MTCAEAPGRVASETERLARFGARQNLAALNHPQSDDYGLRLRRSAAHWVGDSGRTPIADPDRAGTLRLLRVSIAANRGPRPLTTGIIHRFEARNVKVRMRHREVFDFGLAKAFDPTAAGALK